LIYVDHSAFGKGDSSRIEPLTRSLLDPTLCLRAVDKVLDCNADATTPGGPGAPCDFLKSYNATWRTPGAPGAPNNDHTRAAQSGPKNYLVPTQRLPSSLRTVELLPGFPHGKH
jgi:hypothetical protein